MIYVSTDKPASVQPAMPAREQSMRRVRCAASRVTARSIPSSATLRHIVMAAVSLALSRGAPVFAQHLPARVIIPGTAFAPESRGVALENVSGGRRFRGKPGRS